MLEQYAPTPEQKRHWRQCVADHLIMPSAIMGLAEGAIIGSIASCADVEGWHEGLKAGFLGAAIYGVLGFYAGVVSGIASTAIVYPFIGPAYTFHNMASHLFRRHQMDDVKDGLEERLQKL